MPAGTAVVMGHTGVGLRTMVLYRPWWAVFVNPICQIWKDHKLSQGNGLQKGDICFYSIFSLNVSKIPGGVKAYWVNSVGHADCSLARCDKSSVSQEVARNASPGTRQRFGCPVLNSLGFHVFQSVVRIMLLFHVFPIILVIIILKLPPLPVAVTNWITTFLGGNPMESQ